MTRRPRVPTAALAALAFAFPAGVARAQDFVSVQGPFDLDLDARAGEMDMARLDLCGINAARATFAITRLRSHRDGASGGGVRIRSGEAFVDIVMMSPTGDATTFVPPRLVAQVMLGDGRDDDIVQKLNYDRALLEPLDVELVWDASGLVTIEAAGKTVPVQLPGAPQELSAIAFSAGADVRDLELGIMGEPPPCAPAP